MVVGFVCFGAFGGGLFGGFGEVGDFLLFGRGFERRVRLALGQIFRSLIRLGLTFYGFSDLFGECQRFRGIGPTGGFLLFDGRIRHFVLGFFELLQIVQRSIPVAR